METDSENNLEIEVKFFIGEPARLKDRLLKLGGRHLSRSFETNLCFDDPENRLKTRDQLLRLRQEEKTTLTFKSRPPFQDTNFKTLIEHEVEVSSFETMASILSALGFRPVRQYEKWRETFIFNYAKALIDTMPYGDFIELEGDKSAIRDLAGRLNLEWKNRIILNYLAMFDILKAALNLPFNDVTFDNFHGYSFDIQQFLPLFYTGRQDG